MANSETTANEPTQDTDDAQSATAPAEAAEPEAAPAAPAPAAPAPALPPTPPPRVHEADPRYAHPAPRQGPQQARIPFLAGLFSMFPGLGNVYNGLYLRGITFFVIIIGLIGLAAEARGEEPVLIFSIIFVWFFNIFDAYRQATLINYGYTPESALHSRPQIPAWGSGGLVAGVVIFVIGLYGFLHKYFGIDLALLADYWQVVLMAFGGYLITRAVLERKKANAESDDASDPLEGI